MKQDPLPFRFRMFGWRR